MIGLPLMAISYLLAAPSVVSPPSLNFAEAIDLALAHNVAATVAALELERATGLLEEARAASLPTLTGTVLATRLDKARMSGPQLVAGRDQLLAAATLSLSLSPVAWGHWSHARTAIQVSHASEQATRRDLAIATARTYLAVITQIRLLEVGHHAVDRARAHYAFAHSRFEGGVGNRLDELRADQEFANSEAQVNTLYTALARAREALGILVCADGPRDADPNMQLPQIPGRNEAEQEAPNRRFDLDAARSHLRLALEIHRDDWLDFLPSLLLTAQPFSQTPPVAALPHYGWQAQLSLQLPLYDGGVRYGQHTQRLAAVNEADAVLQNALRQARSEVRVAYEALQRAEDALTAQRRAFIRASESIILATEAYQAGAVNNLEVIDAERVARDAETGAIMAEDTVRQARLDVLIAVGHFP